jgi:hypothetical protein
MSDQVARVHKFIEAFNAGDFDAFDTYVSREFFGYAPAEHEETAAQVFHQLAGDLKGAYSDLNVSVEDLTADGDVLVGQVTLSGNRDSSLWGGPDSPNHVVLTIPVRIRFVGDQFTFAPGPMEFPEILEIGRQLNFIPPADKMDQPPPYPVVIPEFVMKVLFTGQVQEKECSHLHDIKVTEPTTDVCEQCVEMGDIWPALRMCLICGFVGCCDTSKNKHMAQHYEETGHPLFRSIRLDEGWMWCYEHNAFFPKARLEEYASGK